MDNNPLEKGAHKDIDTIRAAMRRAKERQLHETEVYFALEALDRISGELLKLAMLALRTKSDAESR